MWVREGDYKIGGLSRGVTAGLGDDVGAVWFGVELVLRIRMLGGERACGGQVLSGAFNAFMNSIIKGSVWGVRCDF